MISLKNYIKTRLKQAYLHTTGKIGHLKKTIACKHIWYGGRHSGFYVHPTLLNSNSIVYSFGIGENISFDRAIIKHHGSQVFGFDPTPKSIHWLQSQELPANYRYFEFGIATKSGFVDFFLPKNPDFVSGSVIAQSNINMEEKVRVQMKSFSDIVLELGHSRIDVLKMDIEGAEYDVIDDIANAKVFVGQILIEFHDRYVKNGVQKSKLAISLLREKGYEIFAVSDSFEEISLIHRSLLVT